MESNIQNCAACPGIGNFLPIRWQCLLHQAPVLFSPGMVVALELEDPADDWEDSSQHEEQKEADAPVYIFAKIMERLQQNIAPAGLSSLCDRVNPLTARYRVDLGKDGDMIVIGAALYSFDPCIAKVLPQSLDEKIFGDLKIQQQSTTASQNFKFATVEDVIGEIKTSLKEAEVEVNPDDQCSIMQRLAKRLYLHWHPDKNEKDGQNADIYSKVCKFCAVVLLSLDCVTNSSYDLHTLLVRYASCNSPVLFYKS
jgi:hypothetical protein